MRKPPFLFGSAGFALSLGLLGGCAGTPPSSPPETLHSLPTSTVVGPTSTVAPAPTGLVGDAAAARFCDLAGQFDDVATATGAASSPGVIDGPPGAVRALAESVSAAGKELVAVAPPEVIDAVRIVMVSLGKAGAGDQGATRSTEFVAANSKVHAYREARCVLDQRPGGDL